MAIIGNVGVKANISDVVIGSGLFVYCTDTHELFVDYPDGSGESTRSAVKMAGNEYVSAVTISGGELKVTKGDGSESNVPIGNYAGSSSNGGAANSVKSNFVVTLNGGDVEDDNMFTFNGSTDKTVDINPSSIGAAPTDHSHSIEDVTDLSTTLDNKLNVDGIAASASKLAAARTITLTGAVSGNVDFDGSDNVSIKTTATVMTAATAEASGTSGVVPAPAAGESNRFLRCDATWVVPPSSSVSNMVGSSTDTAGEAGLVPAPEAGESNRYLRCDGTWQVPPDTTYTLSSFGINATAAQINYLTGVTSDIQTQINNLSTRITTAQNTANTANSNATSAKSITDKYSAMLNIIGNGQ